MSTITEKLETLDGLIGSLISQKPSGEISITENGSYDIARYETASVNVESGGDSQEEKMDGKQHLLVKIGYDRTIDIAYYCNNTKSTIDWGDGSTQNVSIMYGGRSQLFTHTYPKEGLYEITIDVKGKTFTMFDVNYGIMGEPYGYLTEESYKNKEKLIKAHFENAKIVNKKIFEGYGRLKKLFIGYKDGDLSLDSSSFSNCKSLEELNFYFSDGGDRVILEGNDTPFYNCGSLRKVSVARYESYFRENHIGYLHFVHETPNGLPSLEYIEAILIFGDEDNDNFASYYAFYECKNLKRVIIYDCKNGSIQFYIGDTSINEIIFTALPPQLTDDLIYSYSDLYEHNRENMKILVPSDCTEVFTDSDYYPSSSDIHYEEFDDLDDWLSENKMV